MSLLFPACACTTYIFNPTLPHHAQPPPNLCTSPHPMKVVICCKMWLCTVHRQSLTWNAGVSLWNWCLLLTRVLQTDMLKWKTPKSETQTVKPILRHVSSHVSIKNMFKSSRLEARRVEITDTKSCLFMKTLQSQTIRVPIRGVNLKWCLRLFLQEWHCLFSVIVVRHVLCNMFFNIMSRHHFTAILESILHNNRIVH